MEITLTDGQLAAEITKWFENNKTNERIWSNSETGRTLRKQLEKRNNFKQRPGGNPKKGGKAAMIWMDYSNGHIDGDERDERLKRIGCEPEKTNKNKSGSNNTPRNLEGKDLLAKLIKENQKDMSPAPIETKKDSGDYDFFKITLFSSVKRFFKNFLDKRIFSAYTRVAARQK